MRSGWNTPDERRNAVLPRMAPLVGAARKGTARLGDPAGVGTDGGAGHRLRHRGGAEPQEGTPLHDRTGNRTDGAAGGSATRRGRAQGRTAHGHDGNSRACTDQDHRPRAPGFATEGEGEEQPDTLPGPGTAVEGQRNDRQGRQSDRRNPRARKGLGAKTAEASRHVAAHLAGDDGIGRDAGFRARRRPVSRAATGETES